MDKRLFEGMTTPAQVEQKVNEEIARMRQSTGVQGPETPTEKGYRDMLRLTGHAHINGIQLHYYDHDSDKDPTKTGSAAGGVRDDAYRCYTDQFKDKDLRPPDNRTMTAEDYRDRFKETARLRERGMHDDQLAAHITATAGNDKSVVILGAAHLSHPNGLATILAARAASLNIHANQQTQQAYFANKATPQHRNLMGEDHTRIAAIPTYQIDADRIAKPEGQDAANALQAKGQWQGPVCPPKASPAAAQ